MHKDLHLNAAIFDMDGVITDTAELHYESWKENFDQFLHQKSKLANTEYIPFSKEDYLKFVDGVMRNDGIRNFLQSRRLYPDEPTAREALINQLGQAKDQCFLNRVESLGIKCFDSSIKLVNFLKNNHKKISVISSSKYCANILKKAGIYELFDSIISGKTLIEKSIPGKPDPGIFLEAARSLKEAPEHCMIVEDALFGVRAGRAGHFGLVVGIDRNKMGHAAYQAMGADLVVSDLSELNSQDINHWFDINAT